MQKMPLRLHKLIWLFFAASLLAFLWLFLNFGWCTDEIRELELKDRHIRVIEGQLARLQKQQDKLLKDLENEKQKHANPDTSNLPNIYVITPTYARLEQKAELTRLSYTLQHVINLHWILVEDSYTKTPLVTRFLQKSRLSYTHLNVPTPEEYKLSDTDPNWLKPRGVLQRNAGLKWLRDNFNPSSGKGVVYFADDDNTYDLHLFEEMRFTRKVTVWPVGLVGSLRYEKPIVQDGKVTGWYTFWRPERTFAMDMAGFAINANLLLEQSEAKFSLHVKRGGLESEFLTSLGVTLDDLEPKANGCTKILVWHTRTEKSSLKNEEKMVRKYGKGSDPMIEV
ncbi:hypothetical protein CHS0354_021656 [Potamilus streckersoni]|uniref:Galactosylgalactosylxylosylprotein 3-beta-glucuronosyltransferase n=1 Tax=Potamilus streckersoni TaxID=2493646 RepID=A0AAE0SPI1_9BIVA|nr:hypothetical protein CHS0354_021656 [Potamilus streckersoni]